MNCVSSIGNSRSQVSPQQKKSVTGKKNSHMPLYILSPLNIYCTISYNYLKLFKYCPQQFMHFYTLLDYQLQCVFPLLSLAFILGQVKQIVGQTTLRLAILNCKAAMSHLVLKLGHGSIMEIMSTSDITYHNRIVAIMIIRPQSWP